MKIGMVSHPTLGGSGVVASELGMALAQRGHEVHFISHAAPFRLREFHPRVYFHEVDVVTYPLFKYPPYEIGLANKIVDVVQEYGLDVIHAHYAVPHATSAYLAKHILDSTRLKVITTLHGTDITLVGADKSFYNVIKFSIEQSDGVTAVSDYLVRRTREEFNIQREIRRIYNFIDVKKGRPAKPGPCKREMFAPAGEKLLVHASNFRPVKRVGDVVRIFARLHEKLPCKLLLVGEGPERLFVQQLVKELGLREHVCFLGTVDYLEDILYCADLFFLPTEQESFGLVALEAMNCGVPVIGTNAGGLPEVVQHGQNGFLLPVGETAAMAEAALELLSNPGRHLAFSQSARARAALFDIEKIMPEWQSLYEEVLSAR
ncbi:MAG: N-acetyl-alpha-D-glucosaminyl L-malate synthase BshA [candidate division KSB1 bacterium]|nr:N-acetyl-alpha-D-glucosaminyl L-malate synthase BshA [candidate division KSB1 bacterium]MDZ7274797.1 N-acetyl-alpha-D-glucosaminyl L-malate synthase BshA [candidate division KSB1 bacterium]MDZ7285622.1 N-acetyl-alpha-D-glucosaminyl L-malate synthase BshA [candidate division KSB1 bacterium]MDZ7298654.1 N-acetyl-alpha-D-glucosaminyl L-malate synthase BshA [candidate division KSB1 bacterium]MDZ7307494.1 N-acetyl-alpha-D-glucosaminyl L-malate synthase BshA [candidate division KSB1 bacterium]